MSHRWRFIPQCWQIDRGSRNESPRPGATHCWSCREWQVQPIRDGIIKQDNRLGWLRRPNARGGSYIATRREGVEYFTVPDFGWWGGGRGNYFCDGRQRKCNAKRGNALLRLRACANLWMMGGVQQRWANCLIATSLQRTVQPSSCCLFHENEFSMQGACLSSCLALTTSQRHMLS